MNDPSFDVAARNSFGSTLREAALAADRDTYASIVGDEVRHVWMPAMVW